MRRRTLLRLYPRSWRERYGEEFLALLEREGTGPRVVLSVIAGAFDARVSPGAHTAGPLISGPVGPRVLLIPPDRPPSSTRILFAEPNRASAASRLGTIGLGLVLLALVYGLSVAAVRAWGDTLAVRALERGVLMLAMGAASVPAWFAGYTLRTKIAALFWLLLVLYGLAFSLEWLR